MKISIESFKNCDILWSGMEDLMTSLGGGRWQCSVCGYQSKSTNVKYHIEAKHIESSGYNCSYCGVFMKNRHLLNKHLSLQHRPQPNP